ncbi:Ethylene receptor 2 [Dendrobium catenatum]|uniref:histidine kinase n=1 Tax=Dendrobium catenatum TaxID=906689 RepID=A0A2I0VB94_9ASPA|nr:Ethylene receptor 2 [Dendrobium catenatum]
MDLTHELRQRHSMKLVFEHSIPITNQYVVEVKESKGVIMLIPDSFLALASNGGNPELGPIAVIRMPMLKVSNFKVLKESQLMRDKLAEQSRALLYERQNAFRESEVRNYFQRVMSQGIRRPDTTFWVYHL